MMFRISVAAFSLVCATVAQAQSSSYLGRWRIVRVIEPATTAPAPSAWLRTGIVIRVNAILAEGGLACALPEFEEAPVEQEDAFGAALSKGALKQGAARVLKQYGFGDSSLPALRVNCDKARRDFYFAPGEELLTALDGKILVLRKDASEAAGEEQGAADNAFLPVRNASFDCAKAASALERVICDWPEALGADGDMGAQFKRLQSELSKPQAEALLRSQRAFNDYVRKACKLGGALPKAADAIRTASSCVAGATRERADFLKVAFVATSGALRIEPLLVTQTKLGAASWMTHDMQPVLSVAAPQIVSAFQQEVRRALRLSQPLIGARKDLDGSVVRTCEVEFLSDAFASLRCSERVQAGTSVPDVNVTVNFDMKSGKPVALDAIFNRGGEWAKAIGAALEKDLNNPDAFARQRDDILAGKRSQWSFGERGVRVTWQGDGGGPGEDVEIPLDVLRPFVQPNSPWKP